MNWTIPNLLSVLRVLAAPCVAIAFVLFDRPDADRIAILIFIAAAATDYLDGMLARALGQESAFGRMLDPVADKAMVIIALAMILTLYDLQWPIVVPAVLIILREVLISGLREFLGDVKLPVTRVAKWKTTMQMFAIGLLLARGAFLPDPAMGPVRSAIGRVFEIVGIGAGSLGLALLWIAAWFTIVSGVDYFIKGMPYIREKEAAIPTLVAEVED
ncbi:MAG TPA: CDP-diacylglycerol--glycerol-3-phosphate 3-phosphatidyltransferase, partial [Devosiaceae bacterium]|nr:CDP-diacylglycerol--glycerol-3-phosphate 3-phosphatidyltransferase [Devosiaceae bacterium]